MLENNMIGMFAFVVLSALSLFLFGVWTGMKYFKKESTTSPEEFIKLREKNEELVKSEAKLLTEKNHLEVQLTEQKKQTENLNITLLTQFENLAGKIIDQKTEIYKKQSSESLTHLINPLKEKIEHFNARVEKETEDRISLKLELKKMMELNVRLSDDANNLTRALKGDNKMQGDWGEFILENILQACGLKEGVEYITQGRDMKMRDEDNRHQKPDVIVMLPDDKHLVIDSKVSLVHYEAYLKSEEATRRPEMILSSIKSHIDDLAGKKYHLSERLQTPEFVMMFIPLEGAFSLLLSVDPQIFNYAWSKSVIIVSPTTLLATMKTVATLWRHEKQQQNALKIAKESGLLYEKISSFMSHMYEMEKSINNSKDACDRAFKAIATGKGNVISKIERIKTLGAHTDKSIPIHSSIEFSFGDDLEAKE